MGDIPFPGTFRGALFLQKYPCTSCFTLSAVIMGDSGGLGSSLLSRALPLCFLITFEHFKVNKVYKIRFDTWLNDSCALIFPLVFLEVFVMPYILLAAFPHSCVWDLRQGRIYKLPPLRSPSGFVI